MLIKVSVYRSDEAGKGQPYQGAEVTMEGSSKVWKTNEKGRALIEYDGDNAWKSIFVNGTSEYTGWLNDIVEQGGLIAERSWSVWG